MKKRVSLLLAIAMLLSMLPFSVWAQEAPITVASVVNQEVTVDGYTVEYTAETGGILNVSVGACSPGWRYKITTPDGTESLWRRSFNATENCDYQFDTAGTWKVAFYAFSATDYENVAGTVSFDVTFTPSEGAGGEVEKAEFEVATTKLALGDNALTLLDTAVTTIYVFEPSETAVYTFTAPQGAILGYWGAGSWFLKNPNSTTNTYEWTCTGVGQAAYIGVSGVDGAFNLNVAKTGEYTPVQIIEKKYENKATLAPFTVPDGAKLGSYVDVLSDTVHTAVLGADGYYHLDSEEGDVLIVDFNYQDIILSAALNSDRPVMNAYVTDENGDTIKYDIGDAVLAYEEVMDDNGYYPVTEDVILFYQVYAMGAGTFTYYLSGMNYNEECVWMYCMRTMNMDNVVDPEPTEPETEATEPETEATEPASGTVVLDASATATSGSKYMHKFTAEADGTLTVTVGDGSTNWVSDIYSFATFKTIASSSGAAQGTYTAELTKGTSYYIRVYAASGALAATPVKAVFTPAGAGEEPTEPAKDAYAVSTSKLSVGTNNVSMVETAEATLYIFTPSELGTYTVSGPAGSKVGIWGYSSAHLVNPNSTSNSFTWECTGVGQSIYVGVLDAEGQIAVTVVHTPVETEPSEPETEATEPDTQPSEPETEPTVPVIPDENVPAGTVFAVYAEDGTATYYSYGSQLTSVFKATTSGVLKLYQDVDLGTNKCLESYSGNIILDLNGCTVQASYASVGALYVDGGTVTVVDTSAEGDGLIKNIHTNGYGIEIWTGTCNLVSGNVEAVSNGIRPENTGTFNMTGGTVTAQKYGVNVTGTAICNISGGTVNQTVSGSFNRTVNAGSTTTTTISGGDFNGGVPSGSGLKGRVSGGSFDGSINSSYVAAGCNLQDNGDGTYSVIDPNAPVEPEIPTEPSEPETEPTEPSEPETEPTEPSEPETQPTEPSEPETEPTEPEAPVDGNLVVTNAKVTTAGYVYEYTAATAGTVHVSVGDCTPGWRYKVFSPDGIESGYRSKYTAGAECDYYNIAGNWKIVFYAYSSAEADNVDGTVSFTITFTPDAVEPDPSEPETEPTEPETEPTEPETEPTEPSEPEAPAGGNLVVTDAEVTAAGYVYEYTAATAGTLNVTVGACSPGWRYKVFFPDGTESIYRTKWSAGETCDYEGIAGNWKIVFYAYSSAEADNVAGTVSFTVTFTSSEGEGGEVEKAEYEVSETPLVLGDNALTLLDTAITTIFVFEPTETAVYTFTAPQGAILGYWGAGTWFLMDPNSTTNTYEWTCTGVGQTACIGVSGVDGAFNLNVEKTGEYTVVEIPIVEYENKAELSQFAIPEGATLGGYVDVMDQNVTHTAVLGEDGYYHLDSADGPILLVDMNYMDLILSNALKSDRPVMYAYVTDAEGNTIKYDIGNAILAYEEVMDENGYYPLTEDLILFYDTYAVGAGVYTFHVSGNYNADCVWMYCMRTMTLAEPVVEPTVELTHISLNPGKDALGFKAAATDMPEDAQIQISLWVNTDKVVTKATDALRLINILANNGGTTVIYAQATIVDAEGNVIAQSDVEQITMKETLEIINNNWTSYSDTQKNAVKALVATYLDQMDGWNLNNILADLQPKAVVEAVTVENQEMTVSDGTTATLTLNDAYRFSTQDYKEAYANWIADYYVSIDAQAQEGLYLAGNYGSYGWIAVPVPGGETYTNVPVVATMLNTNVTYADLVTFVDTFTCGVADTLGNNAGATVTVTLCLTNPENPAEQIVLSNIAITL